MNMHKIIELEFEQNGKKKKKDIIKLQNAPTNLVNLLLLWLYKTNCYTKKKKKKLRFISHIMVKNSNLIPFAHTLIRLRLYINLHHI